MNAKFLFAATVAVSALATFASTTVLADEINAPLTRAQVNAELDQARADGTLLRTEYDFNRADQSVRSVRTRADVVAEFAAARAQPVTVDHNSSLDANPFGADVYAASTRTRAEVKAETLEAIALGTIPRNDYEYNQNIATRPATVNEAKATLARLFRSNQTGS
ncbi:MAG: DUF4148 domain-containing protein [Burkholderiales bacterium]|nr:DUF4148 domain-containing protein [Burkholderiales bacterium]